MLAPYRYRRLATVATSPLRSGQSIRRTAVCLIVQNQVNADSGLVERCALEQRPRGLIARSPGRIRDACESDYSTRGARERENCEERRALNAGTRMEA